MILTPNCEPKYTLLLELGASDRAIDMRVTMERSPEVNQVKQTFGEAAEVRQCLFYGVKPHNVGCWRGGAAGRQSLQIIEKGISKPKVR